MGTKKRDIYPTRYFKASEFPDKPIVLEIEVCRLEKFERDGKSDEKLVVYFLGQKSGLVVGSVVWDQIAEVMLSNGVDRFNTDDYKYWPHHWLELYRDRTPFQGRMVDCIRVRKPGTPPPKGKAKKPKPDPKPDFDDSIDT